MKEYIEKTVTDADNTPKVEKIKTPLAQIIVEQYHGKTYYNILWLDTKNGNFNIGYGSYNLEFVRKWLAEEFEIVEPAADVVERKRGEWVEVSYWKYKNGHSIHYTAKRCSVCGADVGKKTQYNGCPYCFADMREVDHA